MILFLTEWHKGGCWLEDTLVERQIAVSKQEMLSVKLRAVSKRL